MDVDIETHCSTGLILPQGKIIPNSVWGIKDYENNQPTSTLYNLFPPKLFHGWDSFYNITENQIIAYTDFQENNRERRIDMKLTLFQTLINVQLTFPSNDVPLHFQLFNKNIRTTSPLISQLHKLILLAGSKSEQSTQNP